MLRPGISNPSIEIIIIFGTRSKRAPVWNEKNATKFISHDVEARESIAVGKPMATDGRSRQQRLEGTCKFLFASQLKCP